MLTIGQKLDANKGIGPGFDFLRVFLAFSVIAWHSIALTSGSAESAADKPYWAFVYAIVPTFFALSGFLVTGSALRLPVGQFVLSRVLRIVPALFVDTAVSILIFGTIFTTLPVLDYLTNPATLKYWLNIVGEIHFFLPGVFEDHPITAVNGSLWTIRPELGCYVVMTVLIATGLARRWQVVALSAFFVWLASLVGQESHMEFIGKHQIVDNSRLVVFFLMGSLAYLLRHRIPSSRWLALIALAFIVTSTAFGSGAVLVGSKWYLLAAAPVLTYLIVWLGLQVLPRLPIFDRGDYSYGVYLYGFPVQQTVIELTGIHIAWANFALTFIPVTLLAMFSWHVVEKPTLKLRKRFSLAAKIETQREAAAHSSVHPASAPSTAQPPPSGPRV
ncbi:acyltransferase [Phenylobacterium sp.]|uniref:acyltransferase family protein n=1 Tax=Phenylobacterium sp. TaxID=1871053 RepID=UPI00122B7C1D|nr:acyltransferase [Phenylobacterium sp.]THD63258.1 MAG: acyltransferase [Phenylobacterium sp.]